MPLTELHTADPLVATAMKELTTQFAPKPFDEATQTQLLNEIEAYVKGQYTLNPARRADRTAVPFEFDAEVHGNLESSVQAQLMANPFHAAYRILQFPHARNDGKGYNPWMAPYAQGVAHNGRQLYLNISPDNVQTLLLLWSAIQKTPEGKFVTGMTKERARHEFVTTIGTNIARAHQGTLAGATPETTAAEGDFPTSKEGIAPQLEQLMGRTLKNITGASEPAPQRQGDRVGINVPGRRR